MTYFKSALGKFRHRYAGHPLRLVVATIKTIFLCHVFTEYGFTMGSCAGPSMLPTFEVIGDSVIVSKAYRRGRGIQVGDVVEFDSVVEPGEHVIKRVIGLQGDYVMRDTPGANSKMIQIPQGHCWVVGDNLGASRDSRMFGPLPMALIRGKVLAKVLPWNERRWIENELEHVQ